MGFTEGPVKVSSGRVKVGAALLFVGLLASFGALLSLLFPAVNKIGSLLYALLLSLLCNSIGIVLAASGWGRMADNVEEILRCAKTLSAQQGPKGTEAGAAAASRGPLPPNEPRAE